MKTIAFETRRASSSDADEIAAAHLDSIRSIGARFYPAEVVNNWCARLTGDNRGDVYVKAMECGETFYIAVGLIDGKTAVLGFASHRLEAGQHRTAVYVRDVASRCGVGSALFRLAEAEALAAGALSIHVDASLAAIEFYKANGFEDLGRGDHQLRSGGSMPCLLMRKDLVERQTSGAQRIAMQPPTGAPR
jgi:putative acetyltransferase